MKKLLPIFLFLIIIFLLALNLTYPPSSGAQGCGGIMGSNVAGNWNRENLEFIRRNANCSGPIPIEVIIFDPNDTALLLELQNLLKELNFVPTWRPWGNGMPQGNELQAWINAASVLTIGQFQLFNEPNNCFYGCFSGASPNPVADAAAALAFLEASKRGDIKIPLALMPLSPRTPSGGNFLSEQDYWRKFNDACGGCVKNFDYIGLNIYPQTTPGLDPSENVNKFINDFNAQLNFFAGLGVNLGTTRFIIVEAGLDPGSYTNFQQRVNDTIAFAQALEARILSDPSLFINIDQITFFLMNEAGNQYLIFRQCDASGNCQWVVQGFPVINPNIPPVPILPYLPAMNLTCDPNKHGDRTSRPIPCDPCNLTYSYSPSCATSFTVNDTVTFSCCEGPCVETPWGGIVKIDPTDTTIPFVGYKGEGEDKSKYEQKYLADYFEGTNEYYQNYPMYWLDWINHAGVLRKLTPMEYQNQLKEEMVKRAIETKVKNIHEGGVHDYELNYVGRLCWDAPFWLETLVAVAQRLGLPVDKIADITNYCLFSDKSFNPFDDALIAAVKAILDRSPIKISPWDETGVKDVLTSLDGHFPPEPDEEDYIEKWNAWRESDDGKWYKLWVVAPMVSRDDTPGYIFPYFGWRPKDEPKPEDVPFGIEKVPHVARLYEATQETQNMMLPYWEEMLTVQKKTEPIIASANEKVLGEKILLAQIDPANTPRGCKFLYGNPDCNCCQTGNCIGRHTLIPLPNKMGPLCGWEDCQGGESDFCGGIPPTPPEPAVCGLDAALPVAACNLNAITDSNENDKICGQPDDCSGGQPIEILLQAVDAFENTPCDGPITCDPITGICYDPCSQIITKDVNRKFGIYLLHPYLTDVWEQTGKANTQGLFNLFRPAKVSEFQELDAADEVKYSYIDTSDPLGGSVTPETGKFYFNYLGGVQLGKEWVIEALTPYVE